MTKCDIHYNLDTHSLALTHTHTQTCQHTSFAQLLTEFSKINFDDGKTERWRTWHLLLRFTYSYFDLFVNGNAHLSSPKLLHWRYFRIEVSFTPKFRKIHDFLSTLWIAIALQTSRQKKLLRLGNSLSTLLPKKSRLTTLIFMEFFFFTLNIEKSFQIFTFI